VTAPKLTEAQRDCLDYVARTCVSTKSECTRTARKQAAHSLVHAKLLRVTRVGFLGEMFALTDAGRAALRGVVAP